MDGGQNGGSFQQFGVGSGVNNANVVGGVAGNQVVSDVQNLAGGGANSSFPSNAQSFAQTQPIISSGVGDVVLTQEVKKRRWPMVLAGLIAIVLVIGGAVGLFAVQNLSGTPMYKVKEFLEFDHDAIVYLEDVYYHIYNGELSYNGALLSSGSRDTMADLVAPLNTLLDNIENIESIRGASELDSELSKLKGIVAERLKIYKKGAELYAAIYDVYNAENNLAAASALMKNGDIYIVDTAADFYNYYAERDNISADIELNNCGSWYEVSEICQTLYGAYIANDSFINDGRYLMNAFLRISEAINYDEDGWIGDLIDELTYSIDLNMNTVKGAGDE